MIKQSDFILFCSNLEYSFNERRLKGMTTNLPRKNKPIQIDYNLNQISAETKKIVEENCVSFRLKEILKKVLKDNIETADKE